MRLFLGNLFVMAEFRGKRAAIQGLNHKLAQELDAKQAEIDSLKKEFTEQFASLEQRLLAMEASMN